MPKFRAFWNGKMYDSGDDYFVLFGNGSICSIKTDSFGDPCGFECHEDAIAMFATGRDDMSIKTIYMDDILECETGRTRFKCVIIWDDDNSGFAIQPIGQVSDCGSLPISTLNGYFHKVIGNIHEHPELI